MLCGAAFALYPVLLPASGDAANSITIANAAAGRSSLSIGLVWWGIGMAIAIAYFVLVYSLFRGKVTSTSGGHA
jgi:cytochrome bd ubiquinol oxidase subunit II